MLAHMPLASFGQHGRACSYQPFYSVPALRLEQIEVKRTAMWPTEIRQLASAVARAGVVDATPVAVRITAVELRMSILREVLLVPRQRPSLQHLFW